MSSVYLLSVNAWNVSIMTVLNVYFMILFDLSAHLMTICARMYGIHFVRVRMPHLTQIIGGDHLHYRERNNNKGVGLWNFFLKVDLKTIPFVCSLISLQLHKGELTLRTKSAKHRYRFIPRDSPICKQSCRCTSHSVLGIVFREFRKQIKSVVYILLQMNVRWFAWANIKIYTHWFNLQKYKRDQIYAQQNRLQRRER